MGDTSPSTSKLSIVAPAYNEQSNIRNLYEELMKVLPSIKMPCEIVFVDDGSTDTTWDEKRDYKLP